MAQKSDLIDYYQELPVDISNIYSEFKKNILENRFFQNKDYLLNNSSRILFNSDNWHLRPEYFCYEFYKNPHYYPVILLINNISSRFNFRRDNFPNGIAAPTLSAISNILNQTL